METNRTHVAQDLRGRLFESEVKHFFAALAGRVHEGGCQAGFAAASGARNQNGAAAMKTFAAEHRVQALHTGRDPFLRRFMRKAERREREDRVARRVDQKWM